MRFSILYLDLNGRSEVIRDIFRLAETQALELKKRREKNACECGRKSDFNEWENFSSRTNFFFGKIIDEI